MTSQEIKAQAEAQWKRSGVVLPLNRVVWEKGKRGIEAQKGNRVLTAAERQARSRANRAQGGGKTFTLMLGPAEVEALDKLKTKLGVDDASAIIKDAILALSWSMS
jgi:hypothetical protein